MSKSPSTNKFSLETVFDEGEYIIDFPMTNIIIKPQVRRKKNQTKINEIAKSIDDHGQQQPVIIGHPDENGNCPLYFGFTRYFAQEQRGSATIKAVQRNEPENILITQFVENLHREDLNIVDIALGINDLKEADGLKAKEICEKLQMSNSQVSKYTSIGSMPIELLDRVTPLSSDIDTFYYLSQIYKRSPADAEQLISQGEADGELNRVTVRSASDKLKNVDGKEDETEGTGANTTSGAADNENKAKGKGKAKSDDDDSDTSDDGNNDVATTASTNKTATSHAVDLSVAKIFVSYQDEGQIIEGELIVSSKDKPSEKNCAFVLIDGLQNEIPLEELTFVRISY
ncbi:ParB/RepB/Spo0J family partition protein [Salmonella enterica]|nr:ParB/RepB/Spo0J family partition protein [Salmonella enterica]EEP3373024.1 ParB/RepB/Spo0J family partition protein [Salmonella enterica]EFP6579731.1 ParB/RepB/Spo0J family partition protein [Salmonella enterica]EGC7971014.1 ParB/RepB/Spo0J family partition protein [Salmonella enterica]EIV4461191.1 ParB/RepB/Spo0J family partition protein [Salmonella enterica]